HQQRLHVVASASVALVDCQRHTSNDPKDKPPRPHTSLRRRLAGRGGSTHEEFDRRLRETPRQSILAEAEVSYESSDRGKYSSLCCLRGSGQNLGLGISVRPGRALAVHDSLGFVTSLSPPSFR